MIGSMFSGTTNCSINFSPQSMIVNIHRLTKEWRLRLQRLRLQLHAFQVLIVIYLLFIDWLATGALLPIKTNRSGNPLPSVIYYSFIYSVIIKSLFINEVPLVFGALMPVQDAHKKSIYLPVGQPPYRQNCCPTVTTVLWANLTKFKRIWPIFCPRAIYCPLMQYVALKFAFYAVQYGIYCTGGVFDTPTKKGKKKNIYIYIDSACMQAALHTLTVLC